MWPLTFPLSLFVLSPPPALRSVGVSLTPIKQSRIPTSPALEVLREGRVSSLFTDLCPHPQGLRPTMIECVID